MAGLEPVPSNGVSQEEWCWASGSEGTLECNFPKGTQSRDHSLGRGAGSESRPEE